MARYRLRKSCWMRLSESGVEEVIGLTLNVMTGWYCECQTEMKGP